MQVPIIYINLASRTDRRDFMENQFAQLGLVAERLEAVTIAEVPQTLRDYHAGPRPLRRCSPGAIACSLSHAAAWQMMLDRGYDSAIVLEDDAILDASLVPFTVPGALARLNADIIKLETWRKTVTLGTRSFQLESVELRELTSPHLGCAAYLLSRAIAETSLASPILHKVPVDHFMFTLRGRHLLQSRVLQASPSPAVQLEKHGPASELTRSDINSNRGRARAPCAAGTSQLAHRPDRLRMLFLNARRAMALLLHDPAALFRKPVVIPFAGDQPQR